MKHIDQVDYMMRILQAFRDHKKVYRKYKNEREDEYVDLDVCASKYIDDEDLFDFTRFDYALEWDLTKLWFTASFDSGQHDSAVYSGPEDAAGVHRWLDNILKNRNHITSIEISRRTNDTEMPSNATDTFVTKSGLRFSYGIDKDGDFQVYDMKGTLRYEVASDFSKARDAVEAKSSDIPFTFDAQDYESNLIWNEERKLAFVIEFMNHCWEYESGCIAVTLGKHTIGAFHLTDNSSKATGHIMGFLFTCNWEYGPLYDAGPKNVEMLRHTLDARGIQVKSKLGYKELQDMGVPMRKAMKKIKGGQLTEAGI